jgi:hypothetical protein
MYATARGSKRGDWVRNLMNISVVIVDKNFTKVL